MEVSAAAVIGVVAAVLADVVMSKLAVDAFATVATAVTVDALAVLVDAVAMDPLTVMVVDSVVAPPSSWSEVTSALGLAPGRVPESASVRLLIAVPE